MTGKSKNNKVNSNFHVGSMSRYICKDTLREKCPHSDFSGPNMGKYGPEKLGIRTLFT